MCTHDELKDCCGGNGNRNMQKPVPLPYKTSLATKEGALPLYSTSTRVGNNAFSSPILKMLLRKADVISFFVPWALIRFGCSLLLPVQSTTQPQSSSESNNERKYEINPPPPNANLSLTESLDISERVLGNTKNSYEYGSGSASKTDCSSGNDDGCGGGSTSTDDFLSGSQGNRWYRLLLIAQVAIPNYIIPQTSSFPGTSYLIGNVLVQNNQMVNSNGNQVGTMKMTCIRTTNFVCTWTIFSARLGSDGCTFTAQGLFLPGGLATFENIPVVQYVTITGGTGQCRGITGEIKISPNQLQAIPQTWNYEVFYNIVT